MYRNHHGKCLRSELHAQVTQSKRQGESRVHTAEAGYLPSQFTEGSAKKKKKKQLSHKQLVGKKVAVPLLFSLHPKQEGWKRHKTHLHLQGWC